MGDHDDVEVIVEILPRATLAQESALTLGAALEMWAKAEPELAKSATRATVPTDERTLGDAWGGAIKFVLQNTAHVLAMCRAIRNAIKTRTNKLDLVITCGSNRVKLTCELHDLSDIAGIRRELEKLCRSIADLPPKPSSPAKKATKQPRPKRGAN